MYLPPMNHAAPTTTPSRRARRLIHLGRVEAVAAEHVRFDAEFSGLQDDLRRFGEQAADRDGIGFLRRDLGQRRTEVFIADVKGLGVDDGRAALLELAGKEIAVGLGKRVVVAEDDRDGFRMPFRLNVGNRRRDRLRFGQRVAEHGRSDRRHALGRSRRSHHRKVRALGDRKRAEGFARERRPEHERRAAVGRELLHQVDDLRAVARGVFDVEREVRAARVDDAGLHVVVGQFVRVLLHRAVNGGRTGHVGDHSDLDGFAGCRAAGYGRRARNRAAEGKRQCQRAQHRFLHGQKSFTRLLLTPRQEAAGFGA